VGNDMQDSAAEETRTDPEETLNVAPMQDVFAASGTIPLAEASRNGLGHLTRVYGSVPKYDFELSNIVLSAVDLVPDHFSLDFKSKADVSLTQSPDKMRSVLKLRMSNITAHMKNVHFYYLRKRMPKLEDEGVLDFHLMEPGAKIKIVWEVYTRTGKPLQFNFRRAYCTIRNIKIDIVSAKHKIIDRLATKLFAGTMRNRMETAITDGLSSIGSVLSDRMNKAIRGPKMNKSTSSSTSTSSTSTGPVGMANVNREAHHVDVPVVSHSLDREHEISRASHDRTAYVGTTTTTAPAVVPAVMTTTNTMQEVKAIPVDSAHLKHSDVNTAPVSETRVFTEALPGQQGVQTTTVTETQRLAEKGEVLPKKA